MQDLPLSDMFYPCAESLLDPKNCATKRVSRACDRCRLKKTKCDGRRCCNRCLADDAICVFSKRKRSSDRPYSSEYVQLLEDQQMKLVEGVQELYRRLRRGEGWTGPYIAEDSQGYPLVQDVLDSLAVLAPCERDKPKRKPADASVMETDEEGRSMQSDGSGCISTASPPLSPTEYSQSPESGSPTSEHPMDRLCTTFVTNQHQHPTPKSIPIGQEMGPAAQIVQAQAMLPDGSEFWSLPPHYGSSGEIIDYADFVDPFAVGHVSCNWYPESYTM